MQTQLTQAQQAAQKAQLDNAAMLQAVKLGIAPEKIPFVLKLADMSLCSFTVFSVLSALTVLRVSHMDS